MITLFAINIPLFIYLSVVGIMIFGGICRGYIEYWKTNRFRYEMAQPVHIVTDRRNFERLACEDRLPYHEKFHHYYDDILRRVKEDQKYKFVQFLEPLIHTEIIDNDPRTGDTIIRSNILVAKGY